MKFKLYKPNKTTHRWQSAVWTGYTWNNLNANPATMTDVLTLIGYARRRWG